MGPSVGNESIGDSPTGSAHLRLAACGFWAAVAALVALAFAPSVTPVATAGEYTVWSCRGPEGSPVSTEAWRLRVRNASPVDFNLSDNCGSGGWLGAASVDTGLGNQAQAWATFDLPRGGEITGYSVWRYLWAPAILGGSYLSVVRETVGGTTDDDGCASSLALPNYYCSASGSPTDPDDPAGEHARTGISLDGLDLLTGCTTNPCPANSPGSEFRIYRAAVDIADNASPTPGPIGGTVVGPGSVNGRASITVSGTDQGGGLRLIDLQIDGAPAGSGPPDGAPATCQPPYPIPQPCPRGGARTFTFDTDAMSEGEHVAAGTLTDAAGNSTTWGPVSFTVARPVVTPLPDNGNPATASARLTLDRSLVPHRAGRRAAIRGRLTTTAGAPIAGARLTVDLVELASQARAGRALAPVRTRADGRFRVNVGGAGAKQVTVSYAPLTGGVPVTSATAMARARITLRLKRRPARVRRGGTVRFTGRLAGGGAAARGANVEIQAIVSGRWRAIDNVRTRRGGKLRWTYRFRYVERDALFSFRAVVRRTLGWPWPTLKSKRIKVRVDGRP